MNIQIKNRYTGAPIQAGKYSSMKEALAGALRAHANLSGANLSGADLSGANLSGAYLSGADLSRADLSGANLSGANLSGAYLFGANLSGAYLSGANLSRANLSGAYLSGAYLFGANLSGAYLFGANLSRANLDLTNTNTKLAVQRTRILPEGTLIGWKKLRGGRIAKLRIPAKAKRLHAFGRKCRAEFADVLAIFDGETEVSSGTSSHDSHFVYNVGKRVRPVVWEEDWTKECAGGIHFFITREEAEAF